MPSHYLLAACVGYLCGSVPFGLILTKLAGLGDIRNIGSGNIGATNVLRTGNKKLAALVLALDGFKGWLAVSLLKWWLPLALLAGESPRANSHAAALLYAAAFFAVLGHVFPYWLKFKGGKGVATALGAILALSTPLFFMVIIAWLIVFQLTRISSLSALTAFACAALLHIWLAASHEASTTDMLFYVLVAALIFWRHKANIQRLLKHEEPRFGKAKSP
jgi:glycerol-3-phosphate acyltransferase PlsY